MLPRRVLVRLVVLAALLLVLAGPAPVGAQEDPEPGGTYAPRVEVAPSSDLRERSTVRVEADGFPPSTRVWILECAGEVDPQAEHETCALLGRGLSGYVTDDGGSVRTEVTVLVGRVGNVAGVSCPDPADQCVIRVTTGAGTIAADAPIAFAPGVDPSPGPAGAGPTTTAPAAGPGDDTGGEDTGGEDEGREDEGAPGGPAPGGETGGEPGEPPDGELAFTGGELAWAAAGLGLVSAGALALAPGGVRALRERRLATAWLREVAAGVDARRRQRRA